MKDLSKLEEILGYNFIDKSLLKKAVTHSSYANEHLNGPGDCNERLEFLGDAVLDMVISKIIYEQKTEAMEGVLTKMRASIVCEKSLAKISRENHFCDFLLLGRGEERGGGRNRDSIIADGVEAIIGAIYLDSGFSAASEVVNRFFVNQIAEGLKGDLNRDCKTELQEVFQSQRKTIQYKEMGESGPDHDKTFTFAVYVDDKRIGQGSGKSKKDAQARAAADALENIKKGVSCTLNE